MEEQLLDVTSWVEITEENYCLERSTNRGFKIGSYLRTPQIPGAYGGPNL